ncbi:MAG: hypothetical protein AAGA75_24730 [Cyanobacteria bacterium P01_E01_bin.6]
MTVPNIVWLYMDVTQSLKLMSRREEATLQRAIARAYYNLQN